MIRTCKCGGRIYRDNLRLLKHPDGSFTWQDYNTKVATFRCFDCGKHYSQRKRQPKTKS